MIISSTSASIRSYHWLLAICFALLAHVILLVNYPNDSSVVTQQSSVQQAVVISLKNMKALPTPEPTTTQALTTPQVTPQKIEPIPSKSKPPKKSVKKPKLIEKKRVNMAELPRVEVPTKKIIEENQSPLKKSSTPQVVSGETSDSFPAGISRAKTDDIKLEYQIKLAAWLGKHKRYPKLAKRRKQEGVVKVKFQIDAQGRLLSHQLLDPSPYESLNKEVERMLKRASPMPPIPPALRTEGEQYTYTIPVRFGIKIVY